MATAAIHDGLVYVTDLSGRLYCLEADTGRCLWTHDTDAETWGGALVADGRLYFGNKKGLHVLRAGREAAPLEKIPLGAAAYSTPVAANGALSLLNISLWLLECQLQALARAFEENGGFTEGLHRTRSARRSMAG